MSGRAHLSVAKEGLYWVPINWCCCCSVDLDGNCRRELIFHTALWTRVHCSLWVSGKDSVPHGAEVSIYADLQGFLKRKIKKIKPETLFLCSLQKAYVGSREKLTLATIWLKIRLLRGNRNTNEYLGKIGCFILNCRKLCGLDSVFPPFLTCHQSLGKLSILELWQ